MTRITFIIYAAVILVPLSIWIYKSFIAIDECSADVKTLIEKHELNKNKVDPMCKTITTINTVNSRVINVKP